ncbi:hypothetical protein EMIT0P12_10188 [Pseudomonas sp. IT-P12]
MTGVVTAALPVNTATRANQVGILIAQLPSGADSVCAYLPPLPEKQNLRLLMVAIN